MIRGLALAACVAVACTATTPAPPRTTAAPTADAVTRAASASPGPGWRRIADIPTPRSEVGAVASRLGIYVVGGLGGPDVVERYDPVAAKWERVTTLPIAVDHAMVAETVSRSLFVIGGNVNGRPTDRAFRYDLILDRWTELPRMPGPRSQAAAVARGSDIYVVGGWDGARLVAPTYIFHSEGGGWTMGAAIPTPRDHLAAAELDAKVCAVGGRRLSLDQNLPTLECYVTQDDRWEKLADAPTARGGVGAAVVGRKLFFIGGEQPSGTFKEVEIYDAASGSWSRGPDLPTPRHGIGVAAVGQTVFVLTGGPTPGGSQTAVCEALTVP
ncbi:MAG TPA: kelch repeat-containing protein [Candidatus Limnocylindria bacterium]